MIKVVVKAPAKINLYLEIKDRRQDGYHRMDMVMQSISLYDQVTVTPSLTSGITITANEDIPLDRRNTAYRAAELLLEEIGRKDFGVRIHLEKHIPTEAGLGGASADAAAVLMALSRLTEANLSLRKLFRIAESIGSDVPFCLWGGTAHVEQYGEQIAPLEQKLQCGVVVVMPETVISTAEAFARYDTISLAPRGDEGAEKMMTALKTRSLPAIEEAMENTFELVLDEPKIRAAKKALKDAGVSAAMLTGSGSAVYGLLPDLESATLMAEFLQKQGHHAYAAETVYHGPMIIEEE